MNEKQEADLKKFREIDPFLSEEEFLSFKVTLYSYDHGKYLEEKLVRLRQRAYRDTVLKRYDVKSWNAGRCYNKGSETWARVDGDPLTEEDIQAIKALSYGQYTGTKNVAGDLEAFVTWACDSSD